ncbi:MAG: hypothetical protein Q4D81_09495 [Eubacteriales bacterium]|nr:hypothetical protein [Eubacteriales bacterium]
METGLDKALKKSCIHDQNDADFLIGSPKYVPLPDTVFGISTFSQYSSLKNSGRISSRSLPGS